MLLSNSVSQFRKRLSCAAFGAALVFGCVANAQNQPTPDQARVLSQQGFEFGYPLLMTSITCKVLTATPEATESKAPYNQFAHMRTFPDPTFTTVVTPNVDTLYSSACLDLTAEPVVLSVPDMGNRYYLMPMLSAWSNVFSSPGTRTTGNRPGNFAIVGPNWNGYLPPDVQRIQAPTNLVWIIGRIYAAGAQDFPAVHMLQDQLKLTPLSSWGRYYEPPRYVPVDPTVDVRTPPVTQVNNMPTEQFFTTLNQLMLANPPAMEDQPLLNQLYAIRVGPGAMFSSRSFSPYIWPAIENGRMAALNEIAMEAKSPRSFMMANGWAYSTQLGSYGTDYLTRATVAMVGFGANLALDAVYLRAVDDINRRPLDGRNHYVIHFNRNQIPPVHAFWSLTMYDSQQFLVANSLNRYAIGSASNLRYNYDGSLDIYIQNEWPGVTKESNWLPAPAGSFNLVLRLYWPDNSVLSGVWQVPPVHSVVR